VSALGYAKRKVTDAENPQKSEAHEKKPIKARGDQKSWDEVKGGGNGLSDSEGSKKPGRGGRMQGRRDMYKP